MKTCTRIQSVPSDTALQAACVESLRSSRARMGSLGSVGLMAALLVVGCVSFSGGDAPADAGGASEVTADGSLPPVDGRASGGPDAPSGVAAVAVNVYAEVITLTGGGAAGFADGDRGAARFNDPQGIAVDAAGMLYVADGGNQRIRKVTTAGVVTTLAGSGTAAFSNGSGAAASFSAPQGIAVHATGNIYVGDSDNNCIRKVTPAGVVTTLAGEGINGGNYVDGSATVARFNIPSGVTVDSAGNVYVADPGNARIRKVTPAGVVTTLAGLGNSVFADGTGAAASFNNPMGISVDSVGNAYVADNGNHRVRRVTPAGVVTTLAGSGAAAFADGEGPTASFVGPTGVAVDGAGNVYVADVTRIRRVTPAGAVTTLVGSGTAGFADGIGSTASFKGGAMAVAVDAKENVWVADTANRMIRQVVTDGIGQLVVTWNAPASTGTSGLTGYTVSASAPGRPTATCAPRSQTETSCTIRGLAGGVAYTVSVTAANSAGSSAPSRSVRATPN